MFIDNIIVELSMQLMYTVCVAVISWILSRRKAYAKINDAVKEGITALLRDDILRIRTRVAKQGSISYTQKENLNHMFSAYFGLGGNGVIHTVEREMRNIQPYSDIADIPDEDDDAT